ncbi:MAG: AAA family ATPase [Muribaculaceae bacterium]|nr:AAA family ATPase [Muribaculaceae bacterium]
MAIERLDALDIDNRELFTAIYGLNGSSEVYITSDMRIHNLREALYLYLKEKGYAVVFYDDKAFSYEEFPLLDFFNFQSRRNTDTSAPQKRDFFKGKGPMSRSRNMSAVSNSTNSAQTNESHHDSIHIESGGNQRRYIVYQSEGIFNDLFAYSKRKPNGKLAMVFVTPSTLTFNVEQRKTIINKWNDLMGDFKRNKLSLRVVTLYDFSSPRLFAQAFEMATEELFFLSPFKDWISKDIGRDDNDKGEIIEGRKDRTVFYLGAPGRDEIGHMLNHRRIMTPGGLPHLFGKIKWDNITLQLWQGAMAGKSNLSLICDYMDYEELDQIIDRMETVRAIDKLNSLEGIDNIREQFALYRKALSAHRSGNGSGRFRPHMALMGSPGTGKSTVARLFGDILREDGLLPKGHFIKVSTDELIGQYIGETRPKTRAVCERARGGVLFIDEAYGLMSGSNHRGEIDYGAEAIEVLIQFMEDHDDSLVILAGYTDEINQLINEGNKGFRRRFNELGFFEFKDYSPDVLYRIARTMVKDPATEEFYSALRGIIRYKWTYRNKKFGNVGEMENLVNLISSTYRSLGTDDELDVKHLPEDLRRLVDESLLDPNTMLIELNDILGQEKVKKLVMRIFRKIVADRIKLRTIEGFIPKMPKLNFFFTGNPGTGKSTLARIFGIIMQRLGVFPTSKGDMLTELSGTDLLEKTPTELKKLFEDNIGKVLFIDEAYTLRGSSRVLADIVANIELPEYKNKMSVILAGYTDDIEALKSVNVGLARRFEDVAFTDYTNEELYEILVRKVNSTPNTVMDAEACRDRGIAYFASLPRGNKFGNAGLTEHLLETITTNRDERFVGSAPELRNDNDFAQRILPCDFPGIEQSQPSNSSPSVSQLSVYMSPHFNGVIDLSREDDGRMVSTGSHIYYSVGLIETDRNMGTAFLISLANRYILTASHVVEGHSDFKFTLNMGDIFHETRAELLWNNPEHDFALLQVNDLPNEARYFKLDAATPREPATLLRIMAFPLGTQVSNKALLTSGTISNYEENLRVCNEKGEIRRFNAIRTEAQATHGSSGGPVVLADSMCVIGVLHGGVNESGFYMNIASDILQLLTENNLTVKLYDNDQ